MKKTNYFWIKKDNNYVIVGIKKEAFAAFEPLEGIELPKIGKRINKGEILCVVESSKAALELESPVSGKVVKVNADFPKKKNFSWDEKNSWICVFEGA